MTVAGDMWRGTARGRPLATVVLLLGCAGLAMGQQLVKGPFSGQLIDMRNGTLRVVTILEAPFTMKEKTADGSYKYTGFCVDMINELSRMLKFDYDLYEVPDRTYGAMTDDGEWSGMVGQLVNDKADIALAAFTITAQRERVVDFSERYMDYGTGLLMMRSNKEKQNYFAFLLPFQPVVWACLLAAIFVVAIMLFITSRIRIKLNIANPERDNDRQFNIRNSIWFAYGSLVRKGVEPAPRSLPVRIMAGTWWLFGLIVISTYTANLTAFLTVKRLEQPIRSIDDLAKQTEIAYGIPTGGGLYSFFRSQQGTGTIYELMWNYMNTEPTTFVKGLTGGVERVRQGEFLFMYDTPMLEYLIKKDPNCELMMVGKPFRQLGYGLATQTSNRLSHEISLGILHLKENGKITELRDRWWPKVGCSMDGSESEAAAEGLALDSFVGVYIVVAVGGALAMVAALAEVSWHSYCNNRPNVPTQQEDTNNTVSEQRKLTEEVLRGIDNGTLQILIRKTPPVIDTCPAHNGGPPDIKSDGKFV
ncbi:glutamate receptor ionotropic, delta-2-like isoform X2 [Branchiostoma floridae]|uniref:Glutamate receptor ionotropic, delta-2-like isoform X2 n=1 Tax=Branchiostoma floridae TaxID=7739 RepID=A0A9J7KN31_BRAFL|nr:glutamate receptor ionotropic, delta-2-like isoform X2 [Branchiostoma floridae]